MSDEPGAYAYMLRCADGSYYVGHTDELARRVQAVFRLQKTAQDLSNCGRKVAVGEFFALGAAKVV
jgi:hypothetical protein